MTIDSTSDQPSLFLWLWSSWKSLSQKLSGRYQNETYLTCSISASWTAFRSVRLSIFIFVKGLYNIIMTFLLYLQRGTKYKGQSVTFKPLPNKFTQSHLSLSSPDKSLCVFQGVPLHQRADSWGECETRRCGLFLTKSFSVLAVTLCPWEDHCNPVGVEEIIFCYQNWRSDSPNFCVSVMTWHLHQLILDIAWQLSTSHITSERGRMARDYLRVTLGTGLETGPVVWWDALCWCAAWRMLGEKKSQWICGKWRFAELQFLVLMPWHL